MPIEQYCQILKCKSFRAAGRLGIGTPPRRKHLPQQGFIRRKCSRIVCRLQRIVPTARSLEVLGSGIISERKFSAFSIYSPNSSCFSQSSEDDISLEILSQSAQKSESSRGQPQLARQKREKKRAQTKNLNRFFRSKINEMLRQVRDDPSSSPEDLSKACELLDSLNSSNKIMFSQIRGVIVNPWLQEKFSRCRSLLLKYVHRGKMGMQSKLTMLKYFNKILCAIKNPELFRCWK